MKQKHQQLATKQNKRVFEMNVNSNNKVATKKNLREILPLRIIPPLMDSSKFWTHPAGPTPKFESVFLVDPTQSSPFSTGNVPKKKRKRGESNAWREAEDEALMSAWCWVSSNPTLGKNQNNHTRWTKVSELYEQSRLKNPSQISSKSNEAMRSRFRRLDVLSNKWIACLKAVRSQPRSSGSTAKDDEAAAQSLFSGDMKDKRFEYVSLFNNVMSKNPKWSLDNNGVQQLETNLSPDGHLLLEAGEQPSTRIVKRFHNNGVQYRDTNPSVNGNIFRVLDFGEQPNATSLKRLYNDDVRQLDTNLSVDVNVSLEAGEQPSKRSLRRFGNNDVQQLVTIASVDANVSLEAGEQPSNGSLKRVYDNNVQQLDTDMRVDADVSLEAGEQRSIGSLERLGTSDNVESDTETPESVHHHSEGGNAVNTKHKGKSTAVEDCITAQNCPCCVQLQTLCSIREREIEVMERRIEADREIEKVRTELEEKKIQGKNRRLEMKMLNTLVGKQHLSPAEEQVKFNLLQKYYPQN